MAQIGEADRAGNGSRIVIVEPTAITRILEAIGELALAPRAAPIGDPPGAEWPMAGPPLAHDPFPAYEDEDQRVSW